MEVQPLNTENPMPKPATMEEKRCHQLFIQVIYDFAENTTLNGVKYMAEKKVSVLERLFWISTFLISAVLCYIMVYKTYMKWETGVIITLKEHLVYVNEMPFPAVTICPHARIRQKYYNFTSIYNEEYLNTSSDFHSVVVFCELYIPEGKSNDLDSVHTNIKTFYEVAPKHNDIFEECTWRDTKDCKKAFRPVLTNDGICFTFNNLATDEIFRKNSVQGKHLYLNTTTRNKGWSLEDNYQNNDQETYPRRGRGNGAKEDLFITLKEVQDRDFRCEGHTQLGYKVYLHHPADLPQASLHYYAAQPERTTSFALRLNILDTSQEIAHYNPEVRQCYYPTERYLQFFKKYTSKNCQLECLTNYTLQSCACVSYFMPRNSTTEICKADKYTCADKALDQYALQEGMSESNTSTCRCLPSCYDIHYDADIIVTRFDQRQYYKKLAALQKLDEEEFEDEYGESDDEDYDDYINRYIAISNKNTGTTNNKDKVEVTPEVLKDATAYYTTTQRQIDSQNLDYKDNQINVTDDDNNTDTTTNNMLTEIRIYYRQPRFVAMERSELFGLSQFLADCGGHLGLFLGFSVITFAEIIYFFTLKLCCIRETTAQKTETKDIDNA